ncbi:uncharacterized protein LOC112270696 [Brachypodium distachyon]|nr:uncharacterized protein LOC112270696 [Brachypodium distachyon]|eukprot:XP_024314495.1 uncharacterized protein LOC112270696 [Brachypodium distachyon]
MPRYSWQLRLSVRNSATLMLLLLNAHPGFDVPPLDDDLPDVFYRRIYSSSSVLLFAGGEGTPSAIISKTCAEASNSTTFVHYDFCVGVLIADPAAAAANSTRVLAIIATKLVVDNITSTVLVLEDLMYNIAGCLGNYGEINHTVKTAVDEIHAGRTEAAAGKLSGAAGKPGKCDSSFSKRSAKKNPMSKENQDAGSLSYMAYGITMEALQGKFLATADASSATITKACAGLSNFTTHVDYDFCVLALAADLAAGVAKDARALAVVAANLAVANVSATLLVLDDLHESLTACLSAYKWMANMLVTAACNIHAGHAQTASGLLSIAVGDPELCDMRLFMGSAKKNPMTKENNDAISLSYLAAAIADRLYAS